MIRAKRSPASENLAKARAGCKMFHVEQAMAVEIVFWMAECSMWNIPASFGFHDVPRGTNEVPRSA